MSEPEKRKLKRRVEVKILVELENGTISTMDHVWEGHEELDFNFSCRRPVKNLYEDPEHPERVTGIVQTGPTEYNLQVLKRDYSREKVQGSFTYDQTVR